MTRIKNTGKPSEKIFEEHLVRTRGKAFFLHRFTDAADVRGRTGRTGFQPNQPSDFVSVIDGVTAFTEVKSTHDETAFRFSLLKTTQLSMAERIWLVGGEYVVFVHRIPTNQWFRIDVGVIQHTPKKSIPWDQMERHHLWT